MHQQAGRQSPKARRGMANIPKTKLNKPKTKKGERILREREPQLVETVKRVLLLHGNKPSQIVKDVLTDFHKIQPAETVKYTKKNSEILPFEAGGEVKLEQFASKTDTGGFVFGNHTKKRPNNLILGRFYDNRIYDLLELGIEGYKSIKSFGAAASAVQTENKALFERITMSEFRGYNIGTAVTIGNDFPSSDLQGWSVDALPCLIFAGESFEHDTEFKHAKSMLVDLLRGRVIEGFNLMGIDHVILITTQNRILYLRQYAVRLKKSGTKIPRVELKEMGPSLDLRLRRRRAADPQIEKEAHKQPVITKKKEKNVESDLLEGKVGRIYMPKQAIETMPQQKMKALKRERSKPEQRHANTTKKARSN